MVLAGSIFHRLQMYSNAGEFGLPTVIGSRPEATRTAATRGPANIVMSTGSGIEIHMYDKVRWKKPSKSGNVYEERKVRFLETGHSSI